ncbi:Platelet-activating factor acetylhydrolase, isoform II [Ruminococcaceae bacterium YRB3002]|nr:Platelet-activating factor acetylhydrolase, isoform II [Ruminococcaceae bacterium YRB3002]
MALILFVILAVIEIGFLVVSPSTKKEWSFKRFLADVLQTVVFFIMMIFPGIDMSFRFTSLFILLILRIIVAGIVSLINRKNGSDKKAFAKILSLILSIVLILGAMVPAFLFNDYQGRPLTGPYAVSESEAIILDEDRIEEFENDGSCREIPVHFYYPEGCSEKMPLIVFSHGAFGYYQSNTSTYMELASNGYVVASLDHPYHAFFTKDSSGKTVTVDPEFIQTALTVGSSDDTMSEDELYKITSVWMKLREDDINCVIDSLVKGADTSDVSGFWFSDEQTKNTVVSVLALIDSSKIGLIGHSLGGASSVSVGRMRDDISAVVDLDGTMLGEQTGVSDNMPVINEEPYTTPLLNIDNEEHHNSRIEARQKGYAYSNNVILDNAEEGFSTYLKGAEHMDLTDLPLFSPFLAGMLGSGNIDHGECIDQVNSLVLQFFNCYLKGEGTFTVSESYL